MAEIKPKVGEIWTVTRKRRLFDHLKRGDVFEYNGYRLEVIRKRYWSSEMDCNDLVVLTLRRLTDEVLEKTSKETIITRLKKYFKQLFMNKKNK